MKYGGAVTEVLHRALLSDLRVDSLTGPPSSLDSNADQTELQNGMNPGQ
jgi:hypothetical protein